MSRASEETAQLTRRQREVLSLVVRGYGDKELCRRLGIAYGTLRTHLSRIYAAYGVSSRAELIAHWHRRVRRRAEPEDMRG